MEYEEEYLGWLHSGIKYYKCIYTQTATCILYSDKRLYIHINNRFFLSHPKKAEKSFFRDQDTYEVFQNSKPSLKINWQHRCTIWTQ